MFSYINKLCVSLTTACNLDCIYCHQFHNEKFFEDYDALSKFALNLPLSPQVNFRLLGGEVSIFPDRVENLMREVKKIERRKETSFYFTTSTNGTGMDNIIKWMDLGLIPENGVTISWDGIHSSSLSRKSGTFDDDYFKEVIRKAGGSGHRMHIVHAITPATLPYLHESLLFALDNGIRDFKTYFINEGVYSEKDINEYRKQLTLMAKEFNDRYHYPDKRFKMSDWDILLFHKLKGIERPFNCRNLGRVIHVAVDGKVYPCMYFADHNVCNLGDIKDGKLCKESVYNFIWEVFKPWNCSQSSCVNTHCQECPAALMIEHGTMNIRTRNTCILNSITREVFNEHISKIMISEDDLRTFWNMKENYEDIEVKRFNNYPDSLVSSSIKPLQINVIKSNNIEKISKRGW